MKKGKIIFVLLSFMFVSTIWAKSNDTVVNVDYWSDTYGNFLIGDRYYWNQMGITYANHKLAYCLEPGTWITETTYDSYTDFNIKGFSQSLKEKLELIAYYGYEYPGHQTKKYYLATQELIWRELGIKEMYWSTGAEHGGSRINVENEIATIRSLMQSHYVLPSFHDQTFRAKSGEKITMKDTNGVFSHYEVMSPAMHGTSISGNELTIYTETVGKTTLSFLRDPDSYHASFLYTKNDSQALATFGLSNKVIAKVHLDIAGYSLHLYKKDKDTKTAKPSGDASLAGAVYEISDSKQIVRQQTTNEEGEIEFNDLPKGTYTIREVSPSEGYLLDTDTYQVTVGPDTSVGVNLNVFEKVITNEIELVKVTTDGDTGVIAVETGITFGIYDKDLKLVKEVTTDQYGRAKLELPYGTYVVKQHNTTPNLQKVKDFTITVREEVKEPIQYVLNDAPVTAKLKIVKKDEYGNKIQEAGITFRIYDIDRDRYVTQKLVYPHEQVLDEFVTDRSGEVTLPYPLLFGRYRLEEVTLPDGYLKPTEDVTITLDENTELQEVDGEDLWVVEVTNHAPKGKILIEKLGFQKHFLENAEGLYDVVEDLVPLSNSTFELYAKTDIIQNGMTLYKEGEVIEELTTLDGYATSRELPLGTYCVREIASPIGYVENPLDSCVTLTFMGDDTPIVDAQVTVINKLREHTVNVTKMGEEMIGIKENQGQYETVPLSGVTFQIMTQDDLDIFGTFIEAGTVLFERTTDENGNLTIDELPAGNYKIVEKDVPDGYQPAEEAIFLTIEEDQEEQELVVYNEREKQELLLLKQDQANADLLSGAMFSLYDANKKLIAKNLEAKDGMLKLSDIATSDYYIKETKAPSGYVKKETKQKIHLSTSGMKPIIFLNEKMALPDTSSLSGILHTVIYCFTGLIVGCLVISYIIGRIRAR